MPVLYSPAAVFSPQHLPTWALLAFSAGTVNVVAYLACSRFVTHVTGTVSSIGMDMYSLVLALEYGIVLACFVAGAMMSTALLEGRHLQGKRPLFAAPLLLVAGILAALASAGLLGVFGVFGGSVEGPKDFAFLSILAFAMGLQNAAVAASTGLLVRTTHMTGPATDLGVHLTTALYTTGEARRNALRHAVLRGSKIAAFTAGGAAGVALAKDYGFGAFFVPAVVILFATALSFLNVAVEPTTEPS